jgi:hypothetical protein
MTGFEQAIRRQEWELVSLYLLLGIADAAANLPPESLSALLDLLSGEEEEPDAGRRSANGG